MICRNSHGMESMFPCVPEAAFVAGFWVNATVVARLHHNKDEINSLAVNAKGLFLAAAVTIAIKVSI
mgnify:CR=1 FL=1